MAVLAGLLRVAPADYHLGLIALIVAPSSATLVKPFILSNEIIVSDVWVGLIVMEILPSSLSTLNAFFQKSLFSNAGISVVPLFSILSNCCPFTNWRNSSIWEGEIWKKAESKIGATSVVICKVFIFCYYLILLNSNKINS